MLRTVADLTTTNSSPPVLSGRKLTLAVLVILCILFAGIAYFLSVVHQFDQTQAETAERWRQVAVLLDSDYRMLEEAAATWETSEKSAEWKDRFVRLADQFRTAVDPIQQRLLAQQAERMISEAPPGESARPAASSLLEERVEAYNESLLNERQILESTGGRLVRTFLVIPDQEEFRLVR
jgi:hypothetical protein